MKPRRRQDEPSGDPLDATLELLARVAVAEFLQERAEANGERESGKVIDAEARRHDL